MVITEHIKILKIAEEEISNQGEDFYSVIWITGTFEELLLDGVLYKKVANTILFLNPSHKWKVLKGENPFSKGCVIHLTETLMSEPFLNSLRINKVRSLQSHKIFLSLKEPGLEMRLQAIVDMLEEFLATDSDNREVAILGLINTFFVYCEKLCKGGSDQITRSSKSVAYKFMRLLGVHVTEIQKVGQYARKMNVSSAYLNECVNDVWGVSAKSLIIEQLIMRARHALKFTDKSSKEIAYELGFSSPDYFSSFCKKHIGQYPSEYRKSVTATNL